jgi:hypothetical protein
MVTALQESGVLLSRSLSSGPRVGALRFVAFPTALLVVAWSAYALQIGVPVEVGLGHDVIAELARPH